jgi:hypothetical protein
MRLPRGTGIVEDHKKGITVEEQLAVFLFVLDAVSSYTASAEALRLGALRVEFRVIFAWRKRMLAQIGGGRWR